jgi:hypothetical protein
MLARLDHDDPGWRLDEIEAARPRVLPAENSAPVVIATHDLMADNWPSADFASAFTDLIANRRLSTEEYARLCNEMNEWDIAVAEARKLTDRPHGRFRLVYKRPNVYFTLLGDEQKARGVTQLLQYAALRRIEEGDADGALADCRAMVNAGRAIGDEPLIISQLVRTACVTSGCYQAVRVLAQGEPSPASLAGLQKLLEDEDGFPDLWQGIRGERACLHETVEAIEAGAIPLNQLGSGSVPAERWLRPLLRPVFKAEHPTMLSLMTRSVDAARLPDGQQAEAEAAVEADLRALPRTAILSRLLLPTLSKVAEASRRKHTYLRCLIAGLAAERYRRTHGFWPEALTDLVPVQLSVVPIDPYDGQPLRYLRLPDSIEVYSVGFDRKDDNGNLALSTGQMFNAGFDMGFRLWDVEERGAPGPAGAVQK